MKPIAYALLLGLMAPLAACGSADAKGDEDSPLAEDSKFDTWLSPTEHGEMRFTAPNETRLTDDELFHAWNFTLFGDAEIDIRTQGEMNLDTVMYLYHRNTSDEEWGRFVRKNDDDGALVSSRITHEATAGEYRVIVKGFKTQTRGPFSLIAECTGDGCRASTNMCEADVFESLPPTRSWSLECAYQLTDLLSGNRTYRNGSSIDFDEERCELEGLERTAVDFYRDFWEELIGFEDTFRHQDDSLYVEFSTTDYDRGLSMTANAGGDEDRLEMFFNDEGTLIAAFQNNQSATAEYYCEDDGMGLEAPDEQCFGTLFQVLSRSEESPRESGAADVSAATAVHAGLGAAMAKFIDEAGLDANEVIEYELVTWTSLDNEEGLAANFVGPNDVSAEYTMYLEGEWLTLFITDANGITMTCER